MQLENRSIAKCVILSIITCGIYGIVWGVKIARDAVKVKDVNVSADLGEENAGCVSRADTAEVRTTSTV